MSDPTIGALLAANLRLTDQVVQMALAVMESRGVVAQAAPVAAPVPVPEFDEFAAAQPLSDAEKLFYSEDEEDAKFQHEMYGGGVDPNEPFIKEILKSAGLEPTVTTAE